MKGLKYQLKSVLRDKFCLMTFLLPILVAVALSRECSRRLLKNVQLIPADRSFDAVSVCFHANDIGRRFVDDGGQFFLCPISCQTPISGRPFRRSTMPALPV